MRIRASMGQVAIPNTFGELSRGDTFMSVPGKNIWMKIFPDEKSNTNCIQLIDGALGLMSDWKEIVPIEGYFQIGKYPE